MKGFLKHSLLIGGLFALPQMTWAADDDKCVAAMPEATYKEVLPELKDYKIEKSKDGRSLKETFKTEKIQSVEIERKGCAHYGVEITFKDKALKWTGKNFDNSYWIEKSKEMLALLPGDDGTIKLMSKLIDELGASLKTQKPQVDGNEYQIQITDSNGYNTIGIQVDKKSKGVELTVELDVSL